MSKLTDLIHKNQVALVEYCNAQNGEVEGIPLHFNQEAKQAIKDLVLEIINDDYPLDNMLKTSKHYHATHAVNKELARIRKKVEQL